MHLPSMLLKKYISVPRKSSALCIASSLHSYHLLAASSSCMGSCWATSGGLPAGACRQTGSATAQATHTHMQPCHAQVAECRMSHMSLHGGDRHAVMLQPWCTRPCSMDGQVHPAGGWLASAATKQACNQPPVACLGWALAKHVCQSRYNGSSGHVSLRHHCTLTLFVKTRMN